MLIAKAIEKYKIPREKLVILTKCHGTLNDDPYGGRCPPGVEETKEYVNKHGTIPPIVPEVLIHRIEQETYL